MNIPLNKLSYTFKQKPIVVGGMAMEYYSLRKAGSDIDLIASGDDVKNLIIKYPNRVKDLYGDIGVCPFDFEIWKTINYYSYDFYKINAIEKDNFFIISLEKLLFMKTLVIEKESYLEDIKLIVQKIIDTQSQLYKKISTQNSQLLNDIQGIIYIEKREPQKTEHK